ncbi:tyrosine-type recombinase/integrase [Thiomicrorhabdus cannonii]|uniref:tyrosine-type recombinase/integrase n=1 Tax=Thiomicrorhabdus cannonii TaxID=2748011 RepID=UPI0015BB38F0|nr:tyrosine-type recombinase/integrase [Thiomicrorhabdus cannonii]
MEGENKFSFTIKRLDEITKKGTYYDTHRDANGLAYFLQTEGGKGSFIVRSRINNNRVNITIGKFPNVTIEQARKAARQIQTDLSNGINPNDKKRFERTKQSTLAQMYERYLTIRKLKPTTVSGYHQSFRNVLAPLADIEMTAITYDKVLRTHQDYTKRSPAEADRAMRLLKAIFNVAMDEIRDLDGRPLILENPVKKLGKNKHFTTLERKTRKLESDQLRPFLETVEAMTKDKRRVYQTGADLLLVLLYHGTRFTETASIKWDQVEMKYKRFYLTETKNGRRLWLPMTTETEKVFKRRKALSTGSEYVFPSATDDSRRISDVKKALKYLLEETGILITPHDLRRTFNATGTGLGISPYILKQLVNHAQSKTDVTEGYNTLNADDLREHSQRITDAILQKAGRSVSNSDDALLQLIGQLSDDEKRRLIFKLSNQSASNG